MNDLITMIYSWGLTPVVLGTCLFLIIWSLKEQNKRNKDREEELKQQKEIMEKQVTAISVQCTDFISLALQKVFPVHNKQQEEMGRKINELINEQLHKMLDSSGAARVGVFTYHNGGKDIMGRSFQKMSMEHEVVRFGTAQVMGSYQNIPRTMLPIFNKKMYEKGNYYIEDIEEIKETDVLTYQMLAPRGTVAFFAMAITDSVDKVTGFIIVEFTGDCNIQIKEIQKCLVKKASKISGIWEMNHMQSEGGK